MPGERMEDALAAAAGQQARGVRSILTYLGENLRSAAAAEEVTRHYLDLIERLEVAGVDAQLSVKPTQLGLDIDSALCRRQLQRLVDVATDARTLVWLDMESTPYVDRTLELFREMRERSPSVGIALQAYLYRTQTDLERLLPSSPAIRLVKGAYLEPPALAYPRKADVDANYYRLASRVLDHGPGTLLHIATHDERLIQRLDRYAGERGVTATYEYAMLYGVRPGLQHRLAASGHRLRVLISYGENWFPWYMRRLAERPANLWFVAKSVMESMG
jgi:proline dehydrogenase